MGSDRHMKQMDPYAVEAYRKALMKDRDRPFDGMEQTLLVLKEAGYGLAICSNAFTGHIEYVLSSIGLQGYFDTIGSLDMETDKTVVIRKSMTG